MLKADMIAYDKNGQLVMIVEVKNISGKSKEWAAKLRRNIYAHGVLPATPYFMIAMPDYFYLWKNAGNKPEIIEPTYQTDSSVFLKPWYDRSGVSPASMSELGFEFLLSSWLYEIMYGDIDDILRKNGHWLAESGLLEAVREGRLLTEAEI
ncbi:MAG: hypothetical protein HC887_06665 [Desulfobacteraceae bacterium]|nr:hypothetical protein [Desulfobacteraceae bacterium]